MHCELPLYLTCKRDWDKRLRALYQAGQYTKLVEHQYTVAVGGQLFASPFPEQLGEEGKGFFRGIRCDYRRSVRGVGKSREHRALSGIDRRAEQLTSQWGRRYVRPVYPAFVQ